MEEYYKWFEHQYGNTTKAERKKLGAIFTPPEVSIKALELFDTLEGRTVLDPCCGTGNLLAAAILAGADPNKVYGNEINEEFVELCQERLEKLGVPRWHIHQGDALDIGCVEISSFSPDYVYKENKKLNLWEDA